MKCLIVLLCVVLFCDCHEQDREPKLFFGQKAQTIVSYRQVPEYVTEVVPSSCIVVEPSLPPCRHVRNLEIYPSVPTRIMETQMESNRNFKSEVSTWNPATQITGTLRAPTPPLRLKPQQIKNQSPYYWNWNLFNLFRVQNVTYTETKTEYVTTKVQDPHTVVSFYIKGCRPSKPPFNLPECTKLEQVQQEEKSLLVLAPLKFVSSVDEMITPTKSAFNSENATELNQTTLENN